MKASAFVVGSQDGPGATLTDLARNLRFEAVQPYSGLPAVERQAHQTPLCFFLFATVADVRTLAPIAEAIRFSPSRKVRFNPLMYFCDNPSVEIIKACVNMGFDDVVTRPFSQQRVGDRIQRQIGQTLIYYETATYFGPDRRDREGAPASMRPANAPAGGQFRRLEIVRTLMTGINVVRDQIFAPPAEPEAPAFYL
jgi:hypothetical protein